jgi:RHS repeat-associated protein
MPPGDPFAAYRYDAWGNPQGTGSLDTGVWSESTALIGSTVAAKIAARQPLRYAGYYLDSESGLHYLASRHYERPRDSSWRRTRSRPTGK